MYSHVYLFVCRGGGMLDVGRICEGREISKVDSSKDGLDKLHGMYMDGSQIRDATFEWPKVDPLVEDPPSPPNWFLRIFCGAKVLSLSLSVYVCACVFSLVCVRVGMSISVLSVSVRVCVGVGVCQCVSDCVTVFHVRIFPVLVVVLPPPYSALLPSFALDQWPDLGALSLVRGTLSQSPPAPPPRPPPPPVSPVDEEKSKSVRMLQDINLQVTPGSLTIITGLMCPSLCLFSVASRCVSVCVCVCVCGMI